MGEIKSLVFGERILEILQRLIEIPTPTGEEEKLHEFLSSFLKRIGFQVEIQKIPGSFSNLVGRRGKSKLLLCTHIDTFPVFDHPEPYKLRIEGENLIGRGVVDPKGQIASLLVALENTRVPCQVALTSGEEKDALGSKFLKIEAKEGIVLEPTNLSLAISQAGAIEIEVEIEGKEAHGSVPWEGENAILKAFNIYQELEKMSFLKITHPHFPTGGWINLGKFEGGKDIMVVPCRCMFQADIGVVPGVDMQKAVDEVKNIVTKAGGRIIFRDISHPFEIDPQLKVVELMKKSFKEVVKDEPVIGGMPSWTDAENLLQKGIPCIIFGAGKLSRAHSNHELVSLKELDILSRILIHFLNNWER